jgi:hypothetical protein
MPSHAIKRSTADANAVKPTAKTIGIPKSPLKTQPLDFTWF